MNLRCSIPVGSLNILFTIVLNNSLTCHLTKPLKEIKEVSTVKIEISPSKGRVKSVFE